MDYDAALVWRPVICRTVRQMANNTCFRSWTRKKECSLRVLRWSRRCGRDIRQSLTPAEALIRLVDCGTFYFDAVTIIPCDSNWPWSVSLARKIPKDSIEQTLCAHSDKKENSSSSSSSSEDFDRGLITGLQVAHWHQVRWKAVGLGTLEIWNAKPDKRHFCLHFQFICQRTARSSSCYSGCSC